MIRILTISFVLTIATTACLSGRPEASSDRGVPGRASTSGECGKPGSATDVDREPRYSANYLHRWLNAEGCPVRLDIIMTRRGPNACGGMRVADVLMGWPLGSSHQNPHPARIFVRDPHNVLGDVRISDAFDGNAEVPDDALDTGYRQGDAELWMRPGDDAFIYLVYGDRVERWPHDATPTGCA